MMLESLSRTIGNVFAFSLPMVVISCVILTSLRLCYLYKTKTPFVFYQELFTLSFIIYILCLFQVVTFQDTTSIGSNNFVPFQEIFRYSFGSRLFLKNVFGNLLLFLPFGYFVSVYLKSSKPYEIIVLTLIASISIESTQMMIGRVFDVDDILLNLLGGTLGYYFYYYIQKLADLWPKVFRATWFLNLLSIILLGLIITIL